MEVKEVYIKINEFTNLGIMVYNKDINHRYFEINKYESDIKHIGFINELSEYFDILYLEGKIETLERIEKLLIRSLSDYDNLIEISSYSPNPNFKLEKHETARATLEMFKATIEYKSYYINAVISMLRKMTNTIPHIEQKGEIMYKARDYALAYILECHANGDVIPIGKKKKLEEIGSERTRKSGNTFYQKLNEIINIDLNIESNLIEIAGENWRIKVLNLTKTPEKVDEYLKIKKL